MRSPAPGLGGRIGLLLFTYFFLITCPHTIIKALRTTDLLVKMGVDALPLAYLSAAVVTGLAVLLHSQLQPRLSLWPLIQGSLLFFALSGILLQIVLKTEYGQTSAFLPYFYWIWASVLIVVLMTHFWMAVNVILNLREAKRLIGFLSSGGIMGGILGGLLAGFLTRANRDGWLLPLACFLLLCCLFVVRAISAFQRKPPSPAETAPAEAGHPSALKAGFIGSLNAVRKSSFLVLIAAIVSIGVIVSTLIEYQFFSAADAHYVLNPRGLQSFLGFFFAALTVIAFFFSVLLTGSLLKVLKTRLLLVTPSVLLLGSLGVLVFPFGLLPAVLIKGSDESLGFSLNQSVREILYIPVSPGLRFRAKPFIDMFVCRIAKVVAAILLLVFALLLKKEVKGVTPVPDPGLAKDLSWIVIVLLAAWVLFALKMGKEYIAAIKRNIPFLMPSAGRAGTEFIDIDFVKLVFDLMGSRNRSDVLSAISLFQLLEQNRLTPELRKAISEKTGGAKAASLSDMFSAEGAAEFLEPGDDLSPEEFVANIQQVFRLESYQQLMDRSAERAFQGGRDTEMRRMELAALIGLMRADVPLVKWLGRLISDESPQVSCLAIRSAARLLKDQHLPAIIDKLGYPLLRREAVDALAKFGDAAVGDLGRYLDSGSQDSESRSAAVESLALIGTQEAVKVLIRQLERGDDAPESVIVDALDRIRGKNPDVDFPAPIVQKKVRSFVLRYVRTYPHLQDTGLGEAGEEREDRVEQDRKTALLAILKLLGLIHSHEDMLKARQNIETGTRDSVALVIDWLEDTLNKEMNSLVLPLVEEMTPSERRRRFQKILKNHSS